MDNLYKITLNNVGKIVSAKSIAKSDINTYVNDIIQYYRYYMDETNNILYICINIDDFQVDYHFMRYRDMLIQHIGEQRDKNIDSIIYEFI